MSAAAVGCAPDLGRSSGALDVYVAGVGAEKSLDFEVSSGESSYRRLAPVASIGSKLSVESIPTGPISVQVTVHETGDAKTATAAISEGERTVVFMSFGAASGEGFMSEPMAALVHGLHGVQGLDDTLAGSGALDRDALRAFIRDAEGALGQSPGRIDVREVRLVLDSTASAPLTQLRHVFVNFVSVTMTDPAHSELSPVEIAGGAPPTSGNEGPITVGLVDTAPMLPALRDGNVTLNIRGQSPFEHGGASQVQLAIWVKLAAKP